MFKQISIYTENRQGTMKKILHKLSSENINILGLVTNDGGEFCTIRLSVSDTDHAVNVLMAAGYLCRTTMIAGVELPDQPGALEELFDTIEKMNINVDYLYVGFSRDNNVPIIMFHCEYLDIVSDRLKTMGYAVY